MPWDRKYFIENSTLSGSPQRLAILTNSNRIPFEFYANHLLPLYFPQEDAALGGQGNYSMGKEYELPTTGPSEQATLSGPKRNPIVSIQCEFSDDS